MNMKDGWKHSTFGSSCKIIDQRANQTKSHLCDIKGSFPVDGGPAPDEDEEHGADELGNQGSGEIPPTFRQQRVCRDHLESEEKL